MEKNEIEVIDVLGRAEEISRIVKTVEFYAADKKSISFAVQGEWGCGKTWVLDRVFEELYDIQDEGIVGGRYCVLKYNAWDYDYYNEPLVSLIISLHNQVNFENAIFFKTENARKNYTAAKNLVKEKIANLANTLPIASSIFSLKHDFDAKKDELDAQERLYNPFFDINALMDETIQGLNAISEEKTIVVIVDELDRCLPSYAIKVLERMHHISQRVANILFIYGIAKEQLDNSIRQIFGNDVDLKTYLSKFISFGLRLETPAFAETFGKKYSELLNQFDFIDCEKTDVSELISDTLPDIPMRSREEIINKIIFINKQLVSDSSERKLDFSILPMELFMAYCEYKNETLDNTFITLLTETRTIELSPRLRSHPISFGLNCICSSVCKNFLPKTSISFANDKILLIEYNKNTHSIALLFTYYLSLILKQKDISFYVPNQVLGNYKYLEEFRKYYRQLEL